MTKSIPARGALNAAVNPAPLPDDLDRELVERMVAEADRFGAAGLIREYYSVYAYLCGHSHNNLNALEARHINKSVEPYELQLAKDSIDVELTILIDLSISLPIRSLDLLGPSDQTSYDELSRTFDELRERWSHQYRAAVV